MIPSFNKLLEDKEEDVRCETVKSIGNLANHGEVGSTSTLCIQVIVKHLSDTDKGKSDKLEQVMDLIHNAYLLLI